jgi:hypothetical protein
MNVIKTSTASAWNLGAFLWKHKFMILIIFSLIPTILLSIHVAKETHNPYYPFVQAGMSIINSDSVLYEDIQMLQTNPSKLIGMEKPTIGIYQHIKYFLKVTIVVWTLLGLLSLITLPIFLFYYLFNYGNTSTKSRSLFRALITYFFFILVINLIIIVTKQASGNPVYIFDSSLDFFGKAGKVISWTLPLHGVYALIKYLIFLI